MGPVSDGAESFLTSNSEYLQMTNLDEKATIQSGTHAAP